MMHIQHEAKGILNEHQHVVLISNWSWCHSLWFLVNFSASVMDLSKWYQHEIGHLYWILLELDITSGQNFCQYWNGIVNGWLLHFHFSKTHNWINDWWLVSLVRACMNSLYHNGLQHSRSIAMIDLSFVPSWLACSHIVSLSFVDIIWKILFLYSCFSGKYVAIIEKCKNKCHCSRDL